MNTFVIISSGIRDIINMAGQSRLGRIMMGGTWACINGVWYQVTINQVLDDGSRVLMIEDNFNVVLHEHHESITAVEDFS